MDQALLDLIARFQQNARGISASAQLIRICIWCPSTNVNLIGRVGFYQCQDCQRTWYWNTCWHCKSLIDSREPYAIRCRICDWYICGRCEACAEGGCAGQLARKQDRTDIEQQAIDADWLGNMDPMERGAVMRNLDMDDGDDYDSSYRDD